MRASSVPAGQGLCDLSRRVGVCSIKQLDVQLFVFLCQGWGSFKTRTMRTEFALSTGLTESGPICSLRSVFLLHFAATLRGHSGLWETKRNLLGVCVEVPSPRRTVLLDLRALPARLLVSAQSCNYTLGMERTFVADQAEKTGTE
jgi:hypothetical protein